MCGKVAWHWNRHAHHTVFETLTSLLCFFPLCHHSFYPSPFVSLHLLCHSTWPLHFLSLRFPSFTSFFLFKSFLFLFRFPNFTRLLFLYFLLANEPFFCSSSVLFFHLYLYCYCLLPVLADFAIHSFRLYHQICFFMCILCCLVLFKTNCSFKTSFSIHSIHLHSVALFSNLDLAWVGHVWAQSVRSFLKIPGTVAIWRSIERKALNIQTDTTHSLTDAQCDGIKCVLCGQWACPPLISFPWRIDIILWTA